MTTEPHSNPITENDLSFEEALNRHPLAVALGEAGAMRRVLGEALDTPEVRQRIAAKIVRDRMESLAMDKGHAVTKLRDGSLLIAYGKSALRPHLTEAFWRRVTNPDGWPEHRGEEPITHEDAADWIRWSAE